MTAQRPVLRIVGVGTVKENALKAYKRRTRSAIATPFNVGNGTSALSRQATNRAHNWRLTASRAELARHGAVNPKRSTVEAHCGVR